MAPFHPGGGAIFLAVENVQEAVSELSAKGIETTAPLAESPVCHFATIEDPDGNPILVDQHV